MTEEKDIKDNKKAKGSKKTLSLKTNVNPTQIRSSFSSNRANTVVVYPNGIAKKSKNFVLFKVSPKVTKGSTIRVSSKNKKTKRKNKSNIDWNEQIENAMLKISAVLTLWVLADRVQAQ